MYNLHPGDSILFRRGDVFPGTLRVTASGNMASTLVFGTYGSGNDPVISGLMPLQNWYVAGSGIWETALPMAPAIVNIVLVNGMSQAIGRYPNTTAANGGFLTIGNASGSSSITDNSLPSTPNWTGAEVVIRKNRWVLDRNFISLHDGHTINYISESGYGASAQYGYFFQNDPKTLDQWGEWYYRSAGGKLGIYLPDVSSVQVQASVTDTLLSVNGQQWLVFDHLVFRGANRYAVQLQYANNVRLSNCTMEFSGADALSADHVNALTVEHCQVNRSNDIAFALNACSGMVLRDNTIRNTGTRPGMGKGDSGSYEAILLSGDNNLVEGNTIDSTGYIPITFSGSNITIRHNYIRRFAFVKDDGGGIYTWNHSSDPPMNVNRRIEGNIILDGIGAPQGTDDLQSRQVHGIYIDDNADQVSISNNTVAGCGANGIFLHNAHEISVLHNTLFNNARQLVVEHDNIATDAPIRNLRVAGNIFFARTAAQEIAGYKTISDDLSLFGSFDSNYYCRPIDDRLGIFAAYTSNGVYHGSLLDLDEWNQLYQQDGHSFTSPATIAAYRLQNLAGSNQYVNGNFNNNINGLYAWSAAGNCQASWATGALDGGSLKIAFSSVPGSGAQASVVIGIGQVRAGKQYIIRFSLKGSDEHKKLEVFLRKSQSPYNDLSERRLCRLRSTRSENEYLFTATATDADASIVFAIEEQPAPIYIDNLQLNEAGVLLTNPDDSIRFVCNPSASPNSFTLDGTYIDAFQSLHTGSVELAPYSSAVLIRQSLPTVLATSFLDLRGIRDGNKVALQWSVATGDAAVSYVVERTGGNGFLQIGMLPAENSGGSGHYRFVDSLPLAGRNQYRIRQLNSNGSAISSRIISVDLAGSTGLQPDGPGLTVRPNPATDRLTVSVTQLPASASLLLQSATGAVLRTIPLTGATMVLDITSLSKGVYVLCLVYSNSSICREFVKK